MSAPVDSLSIKVDASARGANQQLDKLVQKMMQLRSSVNGIKVGNINTMAASIQNFSKAASGLSQVKTSDFTRMAKSIEKLSNIRKGELNRAATAITNISKAFSGIGNVSDGANKIAQLAQGISKLGYKSTTQAIENIPKLTTVLRDMMSELSKAPTVSNNIIAMTNAMANLGAQASGIRSLGSAMNSAGTSGNGFFGAMKKGISNIKSFASNIRSATTHNRSFASTLGLLYAKFWTLQRAMGAFGNAVKSSMDYIEEYNYFNVTMEKIASEWSDDFKKYGYENADAYGKSFQGRLTEIMNKMTGFKMNDDGTLTDSGIKNLGLDVTQMTNYAAGVAQVTNSVGLTGEASVVTSKALSMLAGDMSSFRNLDMSTVMTNFSSGLIGQSRALYKYGIDITNATLATYAHEMGIKKDITAMTQGEKMQLRMIAILDQSKVAWGDLAKTINSPSNQLRLLQNNFKALARTIGNMFLPVVTKVLPYVNGLVIAIRRLFEWTASMLGIDLKDVIGNSGGGYSDMFDGIEEDADGASDAVDNTTDSVKKLAKQLMGFDELNVITTNQGSSNNSGGDGEGGSSAPIDLTDQLSAALADYEKVWNKEYKKMTNDAEKFADKLTKLFKNAWTSGDGTDIGTAIATWINKGIKWVNSNVDTFADGLKKVAGIMATSFNGFVEKLDWAGLGTAIGKSLKAFFDAETHFFDTVNWTNFGSSLATSANKAISTGVIQSYIKSIASKLKAAIETAFGAVTTFDFGGLGTAIGQGINDFFQTMGEVNKKTGLNGWEELGVTISESITGLATSIKTAIKTLNPNDIGNAIGDVFKKIKFKDIGIELSDMADAVLEYITKAIGGIPWKDIGQSIADFIKGIKWGKLTWDLTKLANAAVDAIVDAIVGFTKTAPLETAVIGLFATLKLTGLGSKMAIAINRALLTQGITLSQVAMTIAGLIISAKAGFSIGKEIGTWLNDQMSPEDMDQYRYNFKFSDLFTYSPEEWKQGIADMIVETELDTTIKSMIADVLKGDFHFTIPFTEIELPSRNDAIKGIQAFIATLGVFSVALYLSVKEKVDGAIDKLKEKWDSFRNKTSSLVAEAREKAAGTLASLKEKWEGIKNSTAVKTLEQTGKNIIDSAKQSWDAIKSGKAIKTLSQTGKSIIDSAKKSWDAIKSGKATKTLRQKGKDVIASAAKVWDKIKDSSVTKTLKQKGQSTIDKIKKTWDGIQSKTIVGKLDVSAIKAAIKTIIGWINEYIIGSINKISVDIPDWVPKMGGKTFGFDIKKIKVPAFASGGFPNQGQYFLARENGPELVGTIGRKTAVANNIQIVQSVSDGVFNALAPVLTQVVNAVNNLQANSNNGQPLYVEGVSDGDIVRITTKANSNHKKRYGRPLYV